MRAGQSGILRELRAEPGDWRGIGLVLAVFSDRADEAIPAGDGDADLKVEFEIT